MRSLLVWPPHLEPPAALPAFPLTPHRRPLPPSPQANKVHELASNEPAAKGRRGKAAAAADGDEAGLTPEEFQRLHLEVEKFGEPKRPACGAAGGAA